VIQTFIESGGFLNFEELLRDELISVQRDDEDQIYPLASSTYIVNNEEVYIR